MVIDESDMDREEANEKIKEIIKQINIKLRKSMTMTLKILKMNGIKNYS